MEIPDPPDRKACARCMSALVLLWSLNREKWLAFVTEHTDDGPRLIPHRCDRPSAVLGMTRPNPDVAARSRRRMDEIRRAKGWGPNPKLAGAVALGKTLTEETP